MDGIPTTPGSSAGANLTPDTLQPGTIIEENNHSMQPADAVVVDGPPRKKSTRHRILHSLSRNSSSASLSGPRSGRTRSASTPYSRSGASLSCVSLSASNPPFASSSSSSSALSTNMGVCPDSAGSASETPSPQPISSPTTPFPPFPHSVGRSHSSNAIRKVDLATLAGAGMSTGTSAVPADMVRAASMPLLRQQPRLRRLFAQLWDSLPREVKFRVLSYLTHKELVRVSRTNRDFYEACFDGQLWTSFDASEFYRKIPVESLETILHKAGPFVKHLNLRGCTQVQELEGRMLMAYACNNIVNATLEGSRINTGHLNSLIKGNKRLVQIDLTGLDSVHNNNCLAIASHCSQLEVLNLSWCENVHASAACTILEGCPKLRDLRLGEIRGFGDPIVARRFFNANRLERLVLSGCKELNDQTLAIMMHGVNPPRDILTRKPLTPPRALRYLDLSRCTQITDHGLKTVGQCAPYLEGLILSGLKLLTDEGLEPILTSATNLAVLEIEDLPRLTNDLLIEHISKAPCAETRLRHLSLGFCEKISDEGVLPVLQTCKNLTSIQLDNTSITNQTLIEAASIVRLRQPALSGSGIARAPHVGLSMEVYDCHNITWAGVREVLSRNSEALRGATTKGSMHSTQVISLKCYYSWQMMVNEHLKRILQGRLESAQRLEQRWVDFMQAADEANTNGTGLRRRRRRMRLAEQAHAEEQAEENGENNAEGGGVNGIGRRRARTATCAIM
ncbi:f-box domain-containing protein [Ophiostoma piceae UAMH 11346]|uniref:F-box domain-containing protein n=1 Tax=Ophiostoma piceae (strain UAMH 11346) TaxID=1262450 RepID=S3CU66_OPHP1|nr:f-box domain-containing protein [Ophiostoma piceae UAMH 11346]